MLKKIMLIVFLFSFDLSAQYSEVHFSSPANNQIISIWEGSSSVAVNINVGWQVRPQPITMAMFLKLYPNPLGPYGSPTSSIPQQLNCSAGTYTWVVELYEAGIDYVYHLTDADTITFQVNPTITARNSFGAGTISVGGVERSHGYNWTPTPNSSTSLSAIDQVFNNYNRLFDTWTNTDGSSSRNTSVQAPSTSSITVTANFVREFNIDFINSIGSTYVNSQLYSSSIPRQYVREYTSTNAYGNWINNNGIEYTFDHWLKNGISFGSAITPTDHGSYSAVYIGKPTNIGKYASAGASVGQPIVVTWTDNVNTAVNQYQIWRRVKHNGVVGNDVLLTTVGRGVQTYTDNDYLATNGYTNDLLWYDVRSYYSTEGTTSDPDFVAVYGQENLSTQEEKQSAMLMTELPSEYSISNYPNPFNPTTTISYQLPGNSFVTIKVFDMLGKEITTLVNGNKNAGYHTVNFDAGKLTSGIYIYTINAGSYIHSKKMLLMK